jgi:PAS domain S-box-containing protein
MDKSTVLSEGLPSFEKRGVHSLPFLRRWIGNPATIIIGSVLISSAIETYARSMRVTPSELDPLSKFISLIALLVLFFPALFLIIRSGAAMLPKIAMSVAIVFEMISQFINMAGEMPYFSDWPVLSEASTGHDQIRAFFMVSGVVLTLITLFLALSDAIQAKAKLEEESKRLAAEIEERKRAESERDRLIEAIEQSTDTIVIADTKGIIQYVNLAFERTSGYSKEEVLGRHARRIVYEIGNGTSFREALAPLMRQETWSGRLSSRDKSGECIVEDVTVSPVRDRDGAVVSFVAVKRNVTREARLEEQLRQAQKMEAVGQLAGGVAHDFNNLLQAILGYSEMLSQELDPAHEHKALIDQVLIAGERARTLTRQLLAYSRRQVMQLAPLDLTGVVTNLVKMLSRLLGEHIQLEFVSGPKLGLVLGDQSQVEQILVNLCVNARDAMPEGGKLSIELSNATVDAAFCRANAGAKEGSYVRIAVSDTGCGMDEKTLSQAFEPFFTTKGVGQGTGLGLSTVYGIVRQHDGTIVARSRPGQGSTFEIYLPQYEAQAPAEPEEKPKGVIKGGTETILLAEDERMVRDLAARILKSAGYTVLSARDGEEAVNLFRTHPGKIDLSVLDVVMPRMGGKEVQQVIGQEDGKMRFLFCSGYNPDAVHSNFVLDEDVHLLQKPYKRETLLQTVREILDA